MIPAPSPDFRAALDALQAIGVREWAPSEATALAATLEGIRRRLGDLYRLARGSDAERPAPPASLTAREREVLHWLAAGKTDRDIGAILGISPRTVHKHLQRIYEKLGVETRTAAVVRALSWG